MIKYEDLKPGMKVKINKESGRYKTFSCYDMTDNKCSTCAMAKDNIHKSIFTIRRFKNYDDDCSIRFNERFDCTKYRIDFNTMGHEDMLLAAYKWEDL